jgi:methylamine dehydrogenase heavy chain
LSPVTGSICCRLPSRRILDAGRIARASAAPLRSTPIDSFDARSPAARWLLAALCACGLGAHAYGQLPNEPLMSETLPRSTPHWVWVNDMAFPYMADGKAFLLDGDDGRMLGMLSTGYGFNGVIVPRAGDVIYSPETYLARGGRGTRTDVLAIYDAQLRPIAEVALPPKRASIMPMINASVLTDDERFLLLYNFTPAQSVSVVDMTSRSFVGELDTAGCALVYPTGPRTFFSICGDGSLLEVRIDDTGHGLKSTHSATMFDVIRDPVSEKGVRAGSAWLFVSFNGIVYPIDSSASGARPGSKWPLVNPAEQALNWRSGGLQHLALHRTSGRLYAVMHRGDAASHKEPGTDIWVYDIASHRKVQQIAARNKVASITVSQDAHPLLFTSFMGSNVIDIYDALTGQYLRSVSELGLTPTTMVSP